MDTQTSELERLIKENQAHVDAMALRVTQAGENPLAIESLIYEWGLSHKHTVIAAIETGSILVLAQALKTHVRHECHKRRAAIPPAVAK